MAIVINQQPTSPNMVNSNLLWTVASSAVNQPQFKYVLDIYESGSATRLQRIKQQPNPATYGVFDLGQILTNYMESDNVWKAAPFATSSNANKDFIVLFGEEYGTSPSSSVKVYDGLSATPGNPAKSGSAFYTITDGLQEEETMVNWNFPSSSVYTPESASIYNTFEHNDILSNGTATQYVNEGDYATIALYNGNMDNNSVTAQDIFYVQVKWYNSAGSVIQTNDIYNTTGAGGGPRTALSDLWGDAGVYDSQTNQTRLIHIGVGPQNLEDYGVSIPFPWSYYIVTITSQGDDGLENNDGVWATIRFNQATGECAYNGVRFAWKNEYGVWDYYTFTLQSDSSVNIQRTGYEQTFVDFSTENSSVTYDKQRRGQKQFYNALNNVKTANSNWLTQAEADWLRELFFSANVYIQDGTDMLPIVISSANVVEKTNPRTQKNFQYTIEFSPANQLRPRL